MHILLPVGAIEWRNCERAYRLGFQASGVNANAVRMRAWQIERLDSAMSAEIVLRDSGIESVSLNITFATDKTEVVLWNDHVQIARLAADTTVALVRLYVRRRIHFKTYPTTMASTFMCCHSVLPVFFQTARQLFAGIEYSR